MKNKFMYKILLKKKINNIKTLEQETEKLKKKIR